MQNKVKVTICGKEYALSTDENPAYLTALAKQVDMQINNYVQSADNISVLAAAVLVALGYADEATKANHSIDNIRTQIKGYVDEANQACQQRDEAVKERDTLRAKIASLENDLKLKKLKESI